MRVAQEKYELRPGLGRWDRGWVGSMETRHWTSQPAWQACLSDGDAKAAMARLG